MKLSQMIRFEVREEYDYVRLPREPKPEGKSISFKYCTVIQDIPNIAKEGESFRYVIYDAIGQLRFLGEFGPHFKIPFKREDVDL